ncbi:MFS transporter [Beijerinckia indica]|uniref:Major facilitator superfamily MFS_1 n=1 Tax=Beijerinckia indica subsp. indica (strain ATCC 9039 / DSM 1715 / NCIMB 8712) TaxID=395963 RepID=B2IKG3_BEII9|nr:MFS transporter [Beijerinckia indica]ACB96443.1 major facilitator superfamily MFS_1 [Beijerinckia indica subsp. indica ATCC 9039]
MIDEQALVQKITWRLIPYLGFIYLIAYIDRQNVSFAKLQMVGDLGFSEYIYGLGASLFFIGYFLFEVPSNIILVKVGARRWFTRIMLSWGLVTLLLAFTRNATMFYILRFLLGVCEAGFFPGILFLVTLWFPFEYRSRMVGSFMLFSALANAIGAPIGGLLLDLDGMGGLQGWQWVFLITGAPAVIMGIVTLFYLVDGPQQARFLSDQEKAWLKQRLAAEDVSKTEHGNPFKTLLDPRVLLMSLYYIGFPLAAYGLSYWLPTIVKGFGVSNTVNGFINVIPWIFVGLGLKIVPALAAKAGKQTAFIVGPALFGAACLVLSVYVNDNVLRFAFLCGAAVGIFSGQPVLWSLPSTFLTGASAAAGLAMINSVGNLGGFISQNVVPWIKDTTGSTTLPMLFLAACLAIAGLMTFYVQRVIRRSQIEKAQSGLTARAAS